MNLYMVAWIKDGKCRPWSVEHVWAESRTQAIDFGNKRLRAKDKVEGYTVNVQHIFAAGTAEDKGSSAVDPVLAKQPLHTYRVVAAI